MKYFLDTEFIEDGKTIELLSIGIVAEDGRQIYLESNEADLSKADDWVRANVIPHLFAPKPETAKTEWYHCGGYCSRAKIASQVQGFLNPKEYGQPEFWGYFADYDWVVFCQLFGRMVDLPKGYPMYCRDLKQWADEKGVDLSKTVPQLNEHHALADAEWNANAYDYLRGQK